MDLDKVIKQFNGLTDKPQLYLRNDEDLSNSLRNSVKFSYDLSKKVELKPLKSGVLKELIVDQFDLEQIWQQIELQNDALLTGTLIRTSKLLTSKSLLFKEPPKTSVNLPVIYDEASSSSDSEESEQEDDLHLESSDNEEETRKEKTYKTSVVDDQFFKLNEMEEFLRKEEQDAEDPDSGNDSEEDSIKSSVDLFDGQDEEKSDEEIMYKDFFQQEEHIKDPKRNRFLEEEEENEDDNKVLSSLEQRQERLQSKIDELESRAIEEKSWQLKGEISGVERPQNSLLEEIVEVDFSSRPAPVITEQTTLQLEDIIRDRIKNSVFDSVVRKTRLIETPLEYKKKLVLDQEKSKQSLAQIYEKEFLEQQQKQLNPNEEVQEEEPAVHQEIKSLMSNLFRQLDALSNFHFTPKQAIPELKIVSNLPAISMEEVAPIAVSSGALLAPEEVLKKTKGDPIGKNERTSTDKKRQRRAKKLKQQQHGKKLAANKKTNTQKLKTLTKNRNITLMDESQVTNKSSTAFFQKLEEQVKGQIKSVSKGKSKKNSAHVKSAKEFKL